MKTIRIHSVTYAQLKTLMVVSYSRPAYQKFAVPMIDGVELEVTDEEPQNELAIAVANVLLKQFED